MCAGAAAISACVCACVWVTRRVPAASCRPAPRACVHGRAQHGHLHVYHLHVYHLHVYHLHVYHLHVYHLHVYHLHVCCLLQVKKVGLTPNCSWIGSVTKLYIDITDYVPCRCARRRACAVVRTLTRNCMHPALCAVHGQAAWR